MDDDTYSMSDDLEKNSIYIIYIWVYEPTNGTKYLLEGKNMVYLSETVWERRDIQIKMKMNIRKK